MITLASSLIFSNLLILVLLALGGCNTNTGTGVTGSSANKPDKQGAGRGQFLWGVATAAYQIEGGADGRGDTIWDVFQNLPGKISNGDVASVADDSYHKLEEDLALIEALGVNAYRFSLSWTRIFPNFGCHIAEMSTKPDTRGVSYYNGLIDRLLEKDIEPIVTLYHWDLPESLQIKYGGWISRKIIDDFAFYAEFCFKTFGDRVKHWATVNEPWTFVFMGYGTGYFAPGRCSDRSRCEQGDSSTEAYLAAHNVLLAHAEAVAIYRKKYQRIEAGKEGLIGIVLNLDWGEPLTSSADDIAAARRHNEFGLAWFADPIYFGKYPDSMIASVGHRLPVFSKEESEKLKGSVDFLGLNHYSSKYYSSLSSTSSSNGGGGWAEDQYLLESKYDENDKIIGSQADSSWLNVVPWGFFKTLVWVSQRYKSPANDQLPLIIVTENGCDVPSESTLPVDQVLHDDFRINYLDSYISEMKRALSLGLVSIKGYMVWSLLDNFEWIDGYSKRFGLHYVDYSDPNRRRIPKKSASWYKNYISNDGLRWPYNRTLGDGKGLGAVGVEGTGPGKIEKKISSVGERVLNLLVDASKYNLPLYP